MQLGKQKAEEKCNLTIDLKTAIIPQQIGIIILKRS